MEDIIVCVIGGSGFLGQHIVRELQKWNRSQEEKRKSYGSPENSRYHGDERARHVSVNLNDAEDGDYDVEKSSDSDDTDLLIEDDFENVHINIKEIKILDIKPFEPFLEFAEYPPITEKYCDIRLESQLSEELEGVKVVFHCAAASFSLWNNPKEKKETENIYWETNLEGTENVVWGCRKANVKILIFTSTIAAVMGGKSIFYNTESLSPVVKENELLLGVYARSRKRAEDVVIDAHKMVTENENHLLTTVIRPVTLYGEGDKSFIPSLVHMAKKAGGKLPPIGGPNGYHQLTYAGNAAYSHICAMVQLMRNSIHPLRDCGGLAIYVCDDSPAGSSDKILNPFLKNFGLAASTPVLPFFIVLIYTGVINLWSSFWKKIGWPCKLESSLPSYQLQCLAGYTTVVNRTRAELSLQFKPIYSWEESKTRSLMYYEKLIETQFLKALENTTI